MGGACSTHGRVEKCIQNLSQNLKGRENLETRRRLEDNIKRDLKGIGFEDVDCIRLSQDMGLVGGSCEYGTEH
jgi:hypothetical protein